MIVEFSRRKFMLAAGSTALALPVLEALQGTAHAQFENVQRLLVLVSTNGSPRTKRPTGSGANFELGEILSGLSEHKENLLLVRGLDSRAAEISGGDPHAVGFATTLSGAKALEGDEFKHGACFEQADCTSTGWGGGITIDQLVAQAHEQAGVVAHGSLNFSIKTLPGSLYTRMSYSGPGEPIAPESNPGAAFDRIFTGISMDPADVQGQLLRQRRVSALDQLATELVALQARVSVADRERLEAHLTAIRRLEERIARTENLDTVSCTPPTRSALGDGAPVERNAGGMEINLDPSNDADIIERHDVWQEMAIRAFTCDLTRVVTVMFAPSRADTFMPWLGFDRPHHAASHDNDVPKLTVIDNWYAQRVASYVTNLKTALGADGGALFDSTLTLWFNELGEGPDHSHFDKPHVLIGSAGGYFKQNQLVTYPAGTPHNILLTAIAQSMGVETDHVGTGESQLQGGDISLLKA